jgi:glycosyltransferase involved in cell wall biosynthesis
MPKLLRITTAPLSLKYLLRGQMKFMKEHGFDVLMVSSDGPELKDVINYEGCRHEIVPMTRKMTPLADLKALWILYKLIRKEKPDIIHSHTPKAGLLAMLAAKMAGVKLRIHTVAGLRFMTASGTSRKILIAMEKLTMTSANYVWPNSFSLRDYIAQHKMVTPAKLEVIGLGSSNGISLSRFSHQVLQQEKTEEIKQIMKYDPALRYFLFVGRIVHDKGVDELVNAFLHVYQKNDRYRLVLVGSFEDDLDPVTAETKNILRSHPGIILAGWNDSVEYFMSLSFALIHPSHREGFPNVLLQAGALKCPVICSRIEGNIDIIEHGASGLIFECGNAIELQSCMEKATDDPATMQHYADALYAKVRGHFDQPVVHQQLLTRYHQLLGTAAG